MKRRFIEYTFCVFKLKKLTCSNDDGRSERSVASQFSFQTLTGDFASQITRHGNIDCVLGPIIQTLGDPNVETVESSN